MVGLVENLFSEFPLNSRIKISDNCGTVKYVGEVDGYNGLWLGIEWDDPARGKHDGVVKGKRYFQTKHSTSGSLIRSEKVCHFKTLEDTAKEKYLSCGNSAVDEDLMRETQMHLHAALFEIVGMEKISRKQSKLEELCEITVSNSCVSSAGKLSAFRQLKYLNLSATLIWNWKTIAEICLQVPTLTDLNLSCNRFQIPNANEITELQPSFNNVKHLNLRDCGITDWKDVMTTAKLWPKLESLGLQENDIEILNPVNCKEIFLNLRELDLHRTKISNFNEICKLGNIITLESLLLMENNINEINLPYCDYDQKLDIFVSLEKLNLYKNPIKDECKQFNELDKLPSLKNLSKSSESATGFEEMFSIAVALISNLTVINKVDITQKDRRGAEYDVWKMYGVEWLQVQDNPEMKKEFCLTHRSYPKLVKKYGSPEEFAVRPPIKVSNLIQINIQNKLTGEIWQKKIPRKISVQTLQGLIIKHFKVEQTMPRLCYIDANRPELIVELDNSSKSLDFYSIQDGDTVSMEW